MKKSVYLLNLFQFIAFILIMIINIGVTESYKKAYSDVEYLAKPENILTRKIKEENIDFIEELKIEKLRPVLNELVKENKINEPIIYPEGDSTIELEGLSNETHIFNVDKTFLNRYKMNLLEGRQFTVAELKGIENAKELPIIIGYNLKDKFKVGDSIGTKPPMGFRLENDYYIGENGEYITKMYNVKYKVIGIADKGSMISFGDDVPYSIKRDDDMIYTVNNTSEISVYKDGVRTIPVNKSSFNKDDENLFDQEMIIELLDNKYKKEVVNILNYELKDYTSSIEFVDSNEQSTINLQYRQMYISTSVLGGVLGLFLIIGVISTMIYTIDSRKKEYGILLAQGAKKSRLILYNFFMIISFNGIALAIDLLISKIARSYLINIPDEKVIGIEKLFVLDSNLFIRLGSILLIIVLISTIPIVYKVKRYTIIELLRGKN